MSNEGSIPPSILSFLAGALLPPLAYGLYIRKQNHQSIQDLKSNENLQDDSSDDSLEFEVPERAEGSEDPSSWGLTDAPYKVRVFCQKLSL